jgi:hypothetical protein
LVAFICIFYVIAIFLVGMTFASALCITVAVLYFGERRAWLIAAIAIILPALLWYFFVEIAHILFPTPVFGVMNWLEASFVSGETIKHAGFIVQLAIERTTV